MGNSSSVEDHDEFQNVAKRYTYEKTYTDGRFGEIKLLRDTTTGTPVFQKDITCKTREEYDIIAKEIKERAAFHHPNSLRVLGFVSKKEALFCSDFFKISLFFESFQEDLEQVIFNRQQAKDFFLEVELWYIFDSLVSVFAFFQENKINHGDIRTFNIFTNSAREYKVVDPSLFRGNLQPGYFGLHDSLEGKVHYPGPELLKAAKEETPTAFDRVKNDVFSLGLTMLETANLKRCDAAYNWDNHTLNEEAINQLLDEMKDKYTETLIQTIRFCLNTNESERPDFLTLDRELAPYRNDIRARISHQQPPAQIVAERLSVPIEDDLDMRIRNALRKSEETISRSSPSKKVNKHLDPYIYSFINQHPIVQDKPLLQTISPYLSADNKYTMTLTQYPAEEGPNELRASQDIQPNYSQFENRQVIDPKPLATSGLQGDPMNNYQPNYIPASENYQNMPYSGGSGYTPKADLPGSYQPIGLSTSINNYVPETISGQVQYGVFPGGYNNMEMPENTSQPTPNIGGGSFGMNAYNPSTNIQFDASPNNQGSYSQGNTPINTDSLLRQVEENLKRSRTIQK